MSDRPSDVDLIQAIEMEGGAKVLGKSLAPERIELRTLATEAKIVRRQGSTMVWTLKANKLRAKIAESRPAQLVDANIAGHTVRAKVEGEFCKRILRLRHWTGSSWQTLGVHVDDCTPVDRNDL